MGAVKIGGKFVGEGYPVFVVAEIGINHNGSLEIAKQLIDVAVEAGCDAVKFQKRTVEVVYSKEALAEKRKFDASIIFNAFGRKIIEGIEYPIFPEEALRRLGHDVNDTTNGDLKYALEFGMKEFDVIDRYCRGQSIGWFGSAWDGLSAHFLNGYNVPCHKIASACLTDGDLLDRVRSNSKPVILSTGGSTLEQVQRAVDRLGKEDLVILHCIANYPCKDEEVNLSMIDTLKNTFRGIPIGYSGHEPDVLPSLLAVAKGACLIERHITLDKKMPGSDQKASLEPDELRELVGDIRRFEKLDGNGIKQVLSSEASVMHKLRRRDTI